MCANDVLFFLASITVEHGNNVGIWAFDDLELDILSSAGTGTRLIFPAVDIARRTCLLWEVVALS